MKNNKYHVDLENIIDLLHVTDKLYHIMLYQNEKQQIPHHQNSSKINIPKLLKEAKLLIPLTHKYMNTHFPGWVQALK